MLKLLNVNQVLDAVPVNRALPATIRLHRFRKDGLENGLKRRGCGWISADVAGTKKEAEASFFKDLQTSVEVRRSRIGAENET
jgi:hypothetical protein